MRNLVLYSQSELSPDMKSRYVTVNNYYEAYEGIINFSEAVGQFFESEIIILESFFAYSTEMNYRRVLANFFLNLNPCCEITIIERHDNPKLNFLFRSLRCIDFDKFVNVNFSQEFIKLQFKREYFDLKRWKSPFSEFLPFLNGNEAISTICSAIRSHRKMSLVRVGHCEVKFLANNYFYGPTDLKQTYQIQWGTESIEEKYFDFVKDGLISAVRGADFLGFNARTEPLSHPLRILENSISKVILDLSLFNEKQTRVKPNIHWEIGLSTDFILSLQCAKRLVLISSRPNLEGIFKSILQNTTEVIFLEVPGEHKIDGPADLDQRFSRFFDVDEIIPSLSDKGTVFLIGAGVAGKRFCGTASKHGCTAIDLGSTLDAWAGIDSRGPGFQGRYKNFIENIASE